MPQHYTHSLSLQVRNNSSLSRLLEVTVKKVFDDRRLLNVALLILMVQGLHQLPMVLEFM